MYKKLCSRINQQKMSQEKVSFHEESQIRIINIQTINKICPWSSQMVGDRSLVSIQWPDECFSSLRDDRQYSLSLFLSLSPLLICRTGLHFVTIDRTNLICSCYQDFLLSTNSPERGQTLLQVKCENCFNFTFAKRISDIYKSFC